MMRRSPLNRGTSQLKRTPFKRNPLKTSHSSKSRSGLAQRVAESLGCATQHVKKEPSVLRSEAHRRNVAALACICCGIEKRSQAAHLNLLALGKGRGWKVSDALTIPLCVDQVAAIGCHSRLDCSGEYDKKTGEALQLTWLRKTRDHLISLGQWPAQAEADMVRIVNVYLQRAV